MVFVVAVLVNQFSLFYGEVRLDRFMTCVLVSGHLKRNDL
jgi:hypothetical protein